MEKLNIIIRAIVTIVFRVLFFIVSSPIIKIFTTSIYFITIRGLGQRKLVGNIWNRKEERLPYGKTAKGKPSLLFQ